MQVSVNQLIAGGIGPTQAKRFQPFLRAAFERYGLVNPHRVAAFLAQCHVESGGFTRLEENLMYTTAARLRKVFPSRFASEAAAAPYVRNPERIANRCYAGKIGNGPEASGDGWRFRGRGLKQLTGRTNYAEAAAAIGRPYLGNPGLVQEPEDAVLTAAWFFAKAGCNPLADSANWDAITRRVNGPGMLEAPQRRRRSGEFLRALA